MGFRDAADFLQPDFVLSWKGKDYRIPALSAEVGLRCQALITFAKKVMLAVQNGEDGDDLQSFDLSERDRAVLSDAEEIELYKDILGPVWQELIDDKAPWSLIKLMATTAMNYFVLGEEAALAAWEGPKAPPNREARRAAARTGTGAGNGTRKPASTNGTSSPREKARVSTSRSPGGPSSPAGA